MAYIDIINSFTTSRWRYLDRSQGTTWSKAGTASSWRGLLYNDAGDHDVPGIDGGNGWKMGAVRTDHTGNTTGDDGLRALSFLMKVDTDAAGGAFILAQFTNGSLFPTTQSLTYDPATDTFSTDFPTAPVASAVAGIKDGNWHHIGIATRNATNTYCDLYVDGELLMAEFARDGSNNNAVKTMKLPKDGTIIDGVYMDELVVYPTYGIGTTFPVEQFEAQAEYVSPSVLDYEATPEPATATATAPDAVARFPKTVAAEPSTADANMVEPGVRIKHPEAFTLKSSGAYLADGTPQTQEEFTGRKVYYFVKNPFYGRIADGWEYKSAVLSLSLRYGAPFSVYNATFNGSTFTVGSLIRTVPSISGTSRQTFNIAHEPEYVALYSGSVIGDNSWDVNNPAVGGFGSGDSYFEGSLFPPPITNFEATPATASAEFVSPVVDTQAGVVFGATVALANAEMPGGYFADANFNADPATAAALMGAAWFSTSRRVTADLMTADGEAVDPATTIDSNIEITVAAPGLAEGWGIDPDNVNDKAINNDMYDAYFLRSTGRVTDGYVPPSPALWLRFNERSGGKVYRWNRDGTRWTSTDSTYTLTGLYDQGIPGLGGRNALHVDNATMFTNNANVVTHNDYDVRRDGISYEFTVRVAPGHTGHMDIANGTESNGMSSTRRYVNLGVRDGRIYAKTGPGGSSRRRIDDGKWHHVVITVEPIAEIPLGRRRLMFYIDGELDRAIFNSVDDVYGNYADPGMAAMPTRFFGYDTDRPFRGDIMEFAVRRSLQSHEIKDLYLDIFGYKAIRVGPPGITAVGDMFQGARVESNMKKMLILSFGVPWNQYFPWEGIQLDKHHTGFHPRSMNLTDWDLEKIPNVGFETKRSNLSPMLGYGYDDNMDIGQYLPVIQSVFSIKDSRQSRTAVKESLVAEYGTGPFRDPVTHEPRLINLQEDIDLDDYEVIAFQGYPNPVYTDQAHRLRYEAFLRSVNQALADGHKIWMSDAYLAADLGWVSKVDEVPVFGTMQGDGFISPSTVGNDWRGYQVAPHIGKNGQPIEVSQTEIAYPEIGLPNGPRYGEQNLWAGDAHRNNGYRVVNEIPGLTDLPSWEVNELFRRERREMLPSPERPDNYDHHGYRLTNLSGENWEPDSKITLPDGTEVDVPVSKNAAGRGLSVGDQFYDYTWFVEAKRMWKFGAASVEGRNASRNRVDSTWAIPAGHLRVGTPVATFRTTVWNDYNQEVTNPYRNHIRTAVIRPGDVLPDGQKVKGYAFMEFAEHPDFDDIAGVGIIVQERFPAGFPYGFVSAGAIGVDVLSRETDAWLPETPYSYEWDYLTRGRIYYSHDGGPSQVFVPGKQGVVVSFNKTTGAMTATAFNIAPFSLPIAAKRYNFYDVDWVPHLHWNARGLSWLTLVESVDAEFSNTAADVATANAGMLEASLEVDRDVTAVATPAQASGIILAPDEATVKEVNVMAYAATASGMMNGLQGGYIAEVAQSFAEMPQNVRRPLDISEVLFFTVSLNTESIYLRLEEN